MRSRLSHSARRALDAGVLCYLAARAPGQPGPHLIPLVYVQDGGRLWVTTARRSVKARLWRRDPSVAGMVRTPELTVVFRGRVRIYDALDPLSWPASAVAGPQILRAATRFSMKNARFFAGYAVDATRVPLAWTPPGRVFVRIDITAGKVLAGAEVIDEWGAWPEGSRYRSWFSSLPPARGIDLKVPSTIRRSVGGRGEGALGVEAGDALTVLPTRWRRVAGEGAYEAILPERLVRMTRARRDAPAAITIDRASTWRAADMSGMLLQGAAQFHSIDRTTRGRNLLVERLGPASGSDLIRIRPTRAVWWEGWTSGTVVASRRGDG